MAWAPCGAGESSYVLYRHECHGLFIVELLRERGERAEDRKKRERKNAD